MGRHIAEIQNNIFFVKSIEVMQEADGTATVTQVIRAKNLFPWIVEITDFGYHSKGAFGMVIRHETLAVPFSLEPWKETEFSLTYTFDQSSFFSDFMRDWIRERGAPSDPGACVEHFLRCDDFIFDSDDIPTGMAYCFTWNSNPEYTVK